MPFTVEPGAPWHDFSAGDGRVWAGSRHLGGIRLAIWGEKDRFLPPNRSAAVLKRLLTGVEIDLTTEVFPGVGHIMTRVGDNEVAPEYDKIVAAWLSSKIRHP